MTLTVLNNKQDSAPHTSPEALRTDTLKTAALPAAEASVAGIEVQQLHSLFQDISRDNEKCLHTDEPFPLRKHQEEIRRWASDAAKNLETSDPRQMRELAVQITDAVHSLWQADHTHHLTIISALGPLTKVDSVQAGFRDYLSSHLPVSQHVSAPPSVIEQERRVRDGFDMATGVTEEQPILRKLKLAYELLDPRNTTSRTFRDRELDIEPEYLIQETRKLASAISGIQPDLLDAQEPFVLKRDELKSTVQLCSFHTAEQGVRIDIACVVSPFEFEPLVDLQHKLDPQGRRQGQGGLQQISIYEVRKADEKNGASRYSAQEIRDALGNHSISSISPKSGDTQTRGFSILRNHPIAPHWLKRA